MKLILVILPTYNERENIELIIGAVFNAGSHIKNTKLDVLVVDDNSPDGTGTIVRKLQKTSRNLHLITGQKAGLGKAYLRGFRYGLKNNKYDAFVMMDADFSHDPSAIPQLIEALDKGSDYVIGSRYVHGGTIPGNWPIRRIFISRVANWLARFLIGFNGVSDTTGGFKAIKVAALRQVDLEALSAAGYFFQVNLLHEFWSRKLRISEVPITFVDRRFGVSKLKVVDIAEFVYLAYRINPSSRVRRLFRFAFVGACGTVVNLIALHMLVKFGGLTPEVAIIGAIELSIISNFFMNHHYTFSFDRASGAERDTIIMLGTKLLKYNIGALGGALISYIVFTILFRELSFNYLLADLIAIVGAMAWNYWMSTKFIWKIVDEH